MKRAIQLLLISAVLNSGQVFAQNPAPAQKMDESSASGRYLKAGEYDFAYNAYDAGHYKTAFTSAMKRAESGDPTAQTLIAMLYIEGRSVIQDANRAMYWYARAADAGDPQAQLRYGIDIYNGIHVPKDQQKGEEYIRKATEAGVPSAYFYYGQILMDNAPRDERFDIGLLWFLKGAAAGDVNAAYAASQILAEGTSKIAKNDVAARTLLETASNGGNIAAQMELAKWMVEGRGGDQDYQGAFDLMKIVSVNGIPPAQINLARLYREGLGTERNSVMAAAWYMIAKQANFTAEDLETMMSGLSTAQIRQAQNRMGTLLIDP